MASSALEEKINKIRQQNEEIRRRYEEVEEDKKNAAKLNALVQMVPSTDWPERKEPPEFVNVPKLKTKTIKEKHEYMPQFHSVEGKKVHAFAQGEGPPPDPKYNFLADSEREEPGGEYLKESSGNRSHHKVTRGNLKKKTVTKETIQKDSKSNKRNYRDETQPGYDAWRAERNRIDEDRISRQRTAEGSWRREWDNDKVHIADDVVKKVSRSILGDFAKKDHKDSDRRYASSNEHINYNRGGGSRPPHRGSSKSFYGNFDNRSHNTYDQHRNNGVAVKTPASPTSEARTVVATEKTLKVTVNQNNVAKGHVMSVKVNSPSIAGTGRVGPRQRTRVTYSHSDADLPLTEAEPFLRQKSFEDKSRATFLNNQKFVNLKRSHSQKKKENETKYHHQKGELKKEDVEGTSLKHYENQFRFYSQKDQQKLHATKSSKSLERNMKITEPQPSNMNVSQERQTQECSIFDEVKPENSVKHNIHYNVATENQQPMQELKSGKIEALSDENGQTSVQNQIVTETLPKKETKKVSLPSMSDVENAEPIFKDDMNKSSFDNESESVTTDVIKNLQKNNMSSKSLGPNDVMSNEVIVPNESNVETKVTIINEAEPSNAGDKFSLEKNLKQLANDDCDNTEGKVTVQQSMQCAEKSAFLMKEEMYFVMENNNQLVSNKETVKEGKMQIDERKHFSFEQNGKDRRNSSEINSGNALCQENVHTKSVEMYAAEAVEVRDGSEENEKSLQ